MVKGECKFVHIKVTDDNKQYHLMMMFRSYLCCAVLLSVVLCEDTELVTSNNQTTLQDPGESQCNQQNLVFTYRLF